MSLKLIKVIFLRRFISKWGVNCVVAPKKKSFEMCSGAVNVRHHRDLRLWYPFLQVFFPVLKILDLTQH